MRTDLIHRLIALAVLPLFLAISLSSPASGAARFSGTVVSVNASSGIVVISLSDGKKVNIRMSSDAKYMKGASGGSLASFKAGEHVVASIISPLNDDPLVADSLMDSVNASQSAPAAYTIPSNTRVGGIATSGGPSATGGTSPNILANVGMGGGNFNSPMVVNAPFTASPLAANSPATGTALANNMTNSVPLPGQGQGFPTTGTPGSAMPTASPMALNNPYSGQTMTQSAGGPPQADLASLMTGTHNNATTPDTMIHNQPQQKNGGGGDGFGVQGMTNPQAMMTGEQDEQDDEPDPFTGAEGSNNMAMAPCQLNARVMDINYANNVVFYMIVGAQEIGSAVVTQRTRIIDGITKQPLTLQTLPKGSFVVVNGVRRGGNTVEAQSIIVTKRN